MLIEIFCQKLMASNVILAVLDHLKPKISCVSQPWWPAYSALPFQNLWIRPWCRLTKKAAYLPYHPCGESRAGHENYISVAGGGRNYSSH